VNGVAERGRSTFFSTALLPAPLSAFTVSDETTPAEATVAPPAPFSGSATFERASSTRSTWLGDLALELPGFGRVRLAGPKYRSLVCRGNHCTP
jgi:hypothetical protein